MYLTVLLPRPVGTVRNRRRLVTLASMFLMSACGGGASDAEVVAAQAVVKKSALAATATTTWTTCAREGGHCAFTGYRDVRYGTATKYATLGKTDGTPCSNDVFGDPAHGETKSCSYADVSSAASASAADLQPSWTLCASEGQTCSIAGNRKVRYGTPERYVSGVFAGPVPCVNSVFGDPAPGMSKSCSYDASAEADAGTAWAVCAGEWQRCSFSGSRSVRYGTLMSFRTVTYSDGADCSHEVFGDPAPGVAKSCSYSALGSAAPGASGTNPPIVFNATTSARAGDVVSLQGENFGSTPRVFLESAPEAALEIVNRVATNGLAVRIPADAQGALILHVASATGTSARVLLNAARPLHMDTLQLTAGGAFRLFGRNLRVSGKSPSVTIDGLAATLDLSVSDEHMLVGVAPKTLRRASAATVSIDNGNGSGAASLDRVVEVMGWQGVDPFALGVGWAAGFAELAAREIHASTDSRLAQKAACDGSRDDAPAVQRAIDLAAANGGAVVRLPAGRCRLAQRLSLRSNVVLAGAGKNSTELVYDIDYPVYGVGIDLSGLRNLTLTNSGKASEGPLIKDSTHVIMQNVRVRLGTSRQMYLTGNRHIVVSGSDFEQGGSISQQGPYILNDSTALVFEGNTTRWREGAPAFGRIHDSLLRGNRFTRDASVQNGGGTVHSLVLDFAHRIAVIGNVFDVVNGPVTNTTRNDGEAILAEGGGAQRTENLGSVASAGASTLSDPSNTLLVDPFGTGSIPENYGVAIVAGKGAGQTRRVVAYTRPTLTVDRPWDVVPDATSRYATFVWGLERVLIKGNMLSQNPRGIWLYHTAVRDVDVIGNTISEGGGIYLRSYQKLATKSFMPIYNVLIGGNRIVNSNGRWMSYVNSVFVNADARAFGIATIGVEIRSNSIVANRPNVSSGWEEYANTEGFMNMMRVENYDGYESSVMPRLLGSILSDNACTNCDVAVRVGTGAGGTTILGMQMTNTPSVLADWATTSTREQSKDTVTR